jgi:hypothetical protein
MRSLILAAVVLFSMMGVNHASAETSTPVDMSAPPFWMPSYEEFSDLQPDQKSFYVNTLHPALSQIPALKTKTLDQLKEAGKWQESWDYIRTKIYQYCQNKDVKKNCEAIAQVRTQALAMHGNQKLENREAAAKRKKK